MDWKAGTGRANLGRRGGDWCDAASWIEVRHDPVWYDLAGEVGSGRERRYLACSGQAG
jgi:hypothetical protein